MSCCHEPKKAIFYEIKIGKMSCLCENISEVIEDVETHLKEGNQDLLSIRIVTMTNEEYNALPEFGGW